MADLTIDLLGVMGLLLLGLVSYRLKATDGSGSITAFAMGVVIGLTGGWPWVVYLIVFLAAGTLATRYRYDYKSTLAAAQEKGGARSAPNVLANGMTPTLLALAHPFVSSSLIPLMFAASVASALADTLGTEIGLLSSSPPRLITGPAKTTSPGKSGGVTPLGFFAEVVGSLLFCLLGFSLGIVSLPFSILAAVGGVAGSNVDSLLGATVQGYFVCEVCGGHTENRTHCGKRSKVVSGLSWLGNNEVNFIAALAGPLVSAALGLLFL